MDRVLPEGDDEGPGPGFANRVAHAIGTGLADLTARPDEERLAARAARHRRLGGSALNPPRPSRGTPAG
ncbi:hypothetical protein GCM10020229_31270 [Kitasatospora albolonga]